MTDEQNPVVYAVSHTADGALIIKTETTLREYFATGCVKFEDGEPFPVEHVIVKRAAE